MKMKWEIELVKYMYHTSKLEWLIDAEWRTYASIN